MKLPVTVLSTLLVLFAAAPAAARDARLLGSTRLAHHENDVDVVKVSCKPRIKAIRLHAARGQIEIERLWVRYGNGDRDELAVRDRLREGSDSRWIDLPGGKRCVVAVGVIGDTERSFDQARLDIWGR